MDRRRMPYGDHRTRAIRSDARHTPAARRREARLGRRAGGSSRGRTVAAVVRLDAEDRGEAADRAFEPSVTRVAKYLRRARHRGEWPQLAGEDVVAKDRHRRRDD